MIHSYESLVRSPLSDEPRPWTRSSGLILLVLCVLVCSPPLSSDAATYGLEWPGNGSVRRMLYWHNPFPIYNATYIFKVYPRKKGGQYNYYTTFFWGNDGTFTWDGGEGNTYYGAHPYPIPAPSGPGQWEIAVYSNDFVTGSEVQWNRWYTQAFRAWRESPSITHHQFYWDLPNTSKVITYTVVNPTWANKNPPTPAIVMGQAPNLNGESWGGYPGWEEFNGIIRGIQIYSGLLSLSDIQAEINAPKSTTAGQNLIWYLNTNPRPSDVTDKKGTGTPHNPSWSGTTALEWTDQTTPPDTTPPSTPTSLTANPVSSSQINLSWTASTDNVGVTGYHVERCQGVSCTAFAEIATVTGISYSDGLLTAATRYRYRLRATDGAGNLSGYSNVASATTQTASPDTIPPSIPSNLSATTVSSSQISLSWTASLDNVGVTGYRVERCQGVSCTAFAEIATVTGISYSDALLTAATSYRYRVRATDGAGNLSGYSNVASATTQTAPSTTGLVAAYSFNEGSGTSVTDASGNGNMGVINGATWLTQGKFGSGLRFDGVNDYVNVANSTTLNFEGGDFTVSAWVYTSNLNTAMMFGKFGTTGNGWRVFSTPSGRLSFHGNAGEAYSNTGAVVLNQWQHLAAVQTGSGITLYINGVNVSKYSGGNGNYDNSAPFQIGTTSKPPGGSCCQVFFKGRIDEVRIYDRVLSAAEIQTDMNTAIAP